MNLSITQFIEFIIKIIYLKMKQNILLQNKLILSYIEVLYNLNEIN